MIDTELVTPPPSRFGIRVVGSLGFRIARTPIGACLFFIYLVPLSGWLLKGNQEGNTHHLGLKPVLPLVEIEATRCVRYLADPWTSQMTAACVFKPCSSGDVSNETFDFKAY